MAAMKKSTHTPHYRLVMEELVNMREKAGLTQRQLASRLNRECSFVWRIEKGERRLDVVEFFWVCVACNVDPSKIYSKLVSSFSDLE
jgi:transcriptional regulator with XRE-family HTH domain